MSRLFDGSLDSAQSASTVDLSGANNFSLSFQMYWNTFANNDHIAFESSANYNSNSGAWLIIPNDSTNNGGGKFGFGTQTGGIYTFATFTRPSAAAWHQYVLTFQYGLPSTFTAAVDGTNQTLTYSFQTNQAGNFGNYSLNFMCRNGGASLLAAGRLAEVAIWPGLVLSTDDITALGLGYRPIHIRPDKLGWYWPMHFPEASTEPELVATNGAVCVGTSSTDHPRVIY